MKSTIFLIAGVLMLNVTVLFAQVQKDTIQIKKASFVRHDKRLNPKQLLGILQENPESYHMMKVAKSNYDVGNVFGFAGGAVVGWQLGALAGGRKANWTSVGIGGALIVAGIPFSSAYMKQAKKAVAAYNNGLNPIGYRKVHIYPSITSNGFGLTMRF
jgi:hypothetical protein